MIVLLISIFKFKILILLFRFQVLATKNPHKIYKISYKQFQKYSEICHKINKPVFNKTPA